MKILLTGNEGYLGSRLQVYFTLNGHEVIGFNRAQNIETIDRAFLEDNQIETVVNCATTANRVDSRYQLDCADERVNLFGTRQLVKALSGTEIGLVHISTKDIYGNVYRKDQVEVVEDRLVPQFAIDEGQPFRPETVYAKTKLMAEFTTEAHPKTSIVRLSSGYTTNPHRRGNWILHFCRAARAGNPVRVHGSGKQLRDPLHADDLGALILLLHEKSIWGTKLNAGGGLDFSYSILEVLNMISPHATREFVPGGDLGYVTNNGLAEKLTGWRPSISLAEEILVLIDRVKNE